MDYQVSAPFLARYSDLVAPPNDGGFQPEHGMFSAGGVRPQRRRSSWADIHAPGRRLQALCA